MATTTFGRLGETPAEIEQRFGAPTACEMDKAGNGAALYRTGDFPVIRVTFIAGKSRREVYKTEQEGDAAKPLIEKLTRDNPGEKIFEAWKELRIRGMR